MDRHLVMQERRPQGALRLLTRHRWLAMLSLSILLLAACSSVTGDTTVAPPPPTGGFSSTQQTGDNKFQIRLNVTPNHLGLNNFDVTVMNQSGKSNSDITVTLYLDSLDMDMSEEIIYMLPDGNNHFASQGGFMMAGHWSIRVQVRTSDNMTHECQMKTLINT